jgi:ABC-type multidrug transport system fused ATPase/permease subunit
VRAGLSARRLAKDLHRSHSTIVEAELGRRLPPVDLVVQYEQYFGLAPGTLGAPRERARLLLLESPADGVLDEQLGELVCPYKGLSAFQYEDSALFFGRELRIERVLARLGRVRFVAIVGPSGSGKSSFARAGLLPRVSPPGSAGHVVLTPGKQPVDELATAVSARVGEAARFCGDELRSAPGRLRDAI